MGFFIMIFLVVVFIVVLKIMAGFNGSKRGPDTTGGDFDNSHSSGSGSTDFCGGGSGDDGGGCD